MRRRSVRRRSPKGGTRTRSEKELAGVSTTTDRPGTKAATGFDPRHKSRVILDGNDRAGARAMLKGTGFDDEDLKRPIIGVAHCWIETMPCNLNQRDLARHVKDGIRAAGGTPQELNTISISDGVTMGVEGMKASLVSREVTCSTPSSASAPATRPSPVWRWP